VIDSAWTPALDAASAAPLTVVIGPGDAGKTTLVTALANALFDRGFSVGIVDADVGQSVLARPRPSVSAVSRARSSTGRR